MSQNYSYPPNYSTSSNNYVICDESSQQHQQIHNCNSVNVWQNSEVTNVSDRNYNINNSNSDNNDCYGKQNNLNNLNSNTNYQSNSFHDHNSAIIERFHKRQIQFYQQHQRQVALHQNQHYKFVSLDGNQGGVPTRTTSTLTPTTLRNIEQSLFELTNDAGTQAPYQAGFVPPPAPFNALLDNTSNDNNSFIDGSSESGSQSSWHTPITHEENSVATDNSSLPTSLHGSPGLSSINNSTNSGGTQQQTSPQNRRNTGGRRPTKPSNLTPEEEEKRRIRRERNKAAAARCRKRRVDQTNDLLEKVEKLEKEKEELQKEIETCTMQQDELKFILQTHRAHCKKHHSDTSSLINGLTTLRSSPIDIKPIILEEFNTKIIKDEPIDSFDSLDGPPSPKRILLANPLIPQQLPNVSTITNVDTPTMLNTPILTKSPPPQNSTTIVQQNASGAIVATSNPSANNGGIIIKSMSNGNIIATTQLSMTTTNTVSATTIASTKPRPNSLNVPLTIPPSQAHLNKIVSDCGVTITTPSNGVFNFESLMDGRTGLTPVSGPLMPNSNSRHPLELTMTTPTSEPSKLVSL